MEILDMLNASLSHSFGLEEGVDAFQRMCALPVDSDMDMLLYETLSVTHFSEECFMVSLVRQYQNQDGEGEEYMQLHLEMYFPLTDKLKQKRFRNTLWAEELEERTAFFPAVKHSDVYRCLIEQEVSMMDADIFLDGT